MTQPPPDNPWAAPDPYAQQPPAAGSGGPTSGAPAHGTPGYGPPNGAPAYGTPGYGPPNQGAPNPGAPTYGLPSYAAPTMAPEHPKAITALILGLVALLGGFTLGFPGLLSPIAWIVGRRTVREIDASAGAYSGRDKAMAGMVMGIIGTVILVLCIIAVIAFIALVVVGETASTRY